MRASVKEQAEWVNKAMRRPWRTPAGRHTETNDRRAHHHENSNHREFLGLFMRQCLYVVTVFWDIIRVVRPSWETIPAIIRGQVQ